MRLAKINALTAAAAAAGTLQQQVEAFVAQATLLASDGLTWSEAGQLFLAFIWLCVDAAETLVDPSGNPASGEDKKQAVLDAVGYLFDLVAPMLPLPMFLQPFRGWLRAPLRALVLALASGAIEVAVSRLDPEPPKPAPAAAK
jgi:hypothetical protein